MASAASDDRETIVTRLSRLSQLLDGRGSVADDFKSLVSHDGLLDTLFVLYDECKKDSMARNRYAAGFVKKYGRVVEELKRLRVSISDFEIKGVIGRGHFGEVQVVHERDSDSVYALKILHKADTLSQQNVSFYEEERDIMAKANSPWITKLHYAFQDHSNLYLVMDFHPGGDLLSLINRHDDVFNEQAVKFYLAEMVVAINSLHSMGYIHRDIKPENVLIDRTGHIKLVDFGSACRRQASASVTSMPVGTPDYLCPEVLMRLQNSESEGFFGEECDWWSLGICAYEMLYGRTPFTDRDSGSMVVTYANIMNHKDCLTFPSTQINASKNAESLIRGLLTDSASRLDYDAIRAHPFFAGIDFDNIRQMRPPFVPTVHSNDDTSNFEDFEKVKSVQFASNVPDRQTGFTGKDLPFVGFTFSRLFGSYGNRMSESITGSAFKEVSSPHHIRKSHDVRELELNVATLKIEIDSLRKQLSERDDRVKVAEDARDRLERDISSHIAEINGLKRALEMEKKKNLSVDNKATRLLDEISVAAEQTQHLMQKDFNHRLQEQKDVMEQLEEDKQALCKKILKLEKQLLSESKKHSSGQGKDVTVEELKIQIKHECKDAYRGKIRELCERLKKQQQNFAAQEKILQNRAEQVQVQLYEIRQQLDRTVAEKFSLEADVKRVTDECTEALASWRASEERCKLLDMATAKIAGLEEREQHLLDQMNDKTGEVVALEIKVAELEGELRRIRTEKSDIENQSIVISEENEARMQNILQQEAVIAKMKLNMASLEEQVKSLKADLTEVRRSHSQDRHLAHTELHITTSESPRKSASTTRARSGSGSGNGTAKRQSSSDEPHLTFTYVYKRNKTRDWVPADRLEESDAAVDESMISDNEGSLCKKDERCSREETSRKAGDGRTAAVFISPDRRCCTNCKVSTTNSHGISTIRVQSQRSAVTQTDIIGKVSLKSEGIQVDSSSQDSSLTTVSSVEEQNVVHISPTNTNGTFEDNLSCLSGGADSLDDSFNNLVETNSDTSGCQGFNVKLSTRVKCIKRCHIAKQAAEMMEASSSLTDALCESSADSVSASNLNNGFLGPDEVNDSKVKIQNLEMELELLKSDKAQLEKLVTSLTDELNRCRHSLNRHIEMEQQSQKAELEQQLAGLKMELEHCQQSVGTKNEEELATLRLEKERIEKVVASLTDELNHCRYSLDRHREMEQQTQKVELDQQLVGLKRELERCQQSVAVKHDDELVMLRLEKSRLEDLAASLASEVDRIKDSTHEQRIRALDLKHELREKTATMSNEIADLNFRLTKSELEARDAIEGLTKSREKEIELRNRLQVMQSERDSAVQEEKRVTAEFKTCKRDLEREIEQLRKQLEATKNLEQDFNQKKEQLKAELDQSSAKCAEVEKRAQDFETRLNSLKIEKQSLEMNVQKTEFEIAENKRHSESLGQQVDQLKDLCKELESQIQDLEKIIECKERQLEQLSSQRESEQKAAEASSRSELNRVAKELDSTKAKLAQLNMAFEALNTQMMELEHSHSVLEMENKRLRARLEGAQAESKPKNDVEDRLRTTVEEKNRLNSELATTKRELTDSRMQIQQLKNLCMELEAQIVDLEHINSRQQESQSRFSSTEENYKKTIETLEVEVKKLQSLLNTEKQLRISSEERAADASRKIESLRTAQNRDTERLKTHLAENSQLTDQINSQLTHAEEKRALLEHDIKNLQRRLSAAEEENIALKEEISKHITQNHELKANNVALAKQLELSATRCHSLVAARSNLEGQVEEMQSNYQCEKYRLEETMSQQSKLIGFLQEKVEHTPKKRKWLFGGKISHPVEQIACAPLRDAYGTLHRERDKNRPLTMHITQTSSSSSAAPAGRPKSDIEREPASQPSAPPLPNHGATLPGKLQTTNSASARVVASKEARSHRLISGINSRPTQCIVCLGSVHFVQQAAKCQDCGAVCHPRCLSNLPSNCGLPNEYARCMLEVVSRVRTSSTSTDRTIASSKSASQLHQSGFLKLPRPGKTVWDRKWVVLRDTKLLVYNSREESTCSARPVDEFELCPQNGVVSVRSAVTATELSNVTPSDLPYIMMLEFEPDTAGLSNRCQYLMALSFAEKQQWAAILEAIASTNRNSNSIKDARVFGNTICRLSARDGGQRPDIVCTWPLNPDCLLLGTDTGLFSMPFKHDADGNRMTRIRGVEGAVHVIEGSKDVGLLFFVVGPDHDVVTCEASAISQWLQGSSHTTQPQDVEFSPVENANACTTLAVKKTSDGLYLCVATTDSIILYKYNTSIKTFCIRKEVQVSQPCCCIAFTSRGVVFGAEKFFFIDFISCAVSEFLDKSDRSLAFAVFGAAQYDSYPIAAIPVNPSHGSIEELLLCFHEFGVFVDNCGRRSRKQNVRWTGLPLMFAYREPFLYTVHYNAVQVIEIMPRTSDSAPPVGTKTFVNIIGAQHLGPALTSGAIYVAQVYENTVEIICIRGNTAVTASDH